MSRNPMASNLRNYRQQIVPDKRDRATARQLETERLGYAMRDCFVAALDESIDGPR
jgi:hypothetical protein